MKLIKNRKQLRKVFARVKGLIPSMASATVGMAAGPLSGAVVGAFLNLAENDFASRVLSDREKDRVQVTLSLAKKRIAERITAGDSIRTDDFFQTDENMDRNCKADEVLESLLLVSQREPQQSKIPYMAYLLANCCFDQSLDSSELHIMIKIAEKLSYRQLCLLSLVNLNGILTDDTLAFTQQSARAHQLGVRNLRKEHRLKWESVTMHEYLMLRDCTELCEKELIFHRGPNASRFVEEGSNYWLNLRPGRLILMESGGVLCKLMQLHQIPDSDLADLIPTLS